MARGTSRSRRCAARNVPALLREISHDDRAARRAGVAGEAATSHPVSLQQPDARRAAVGHEEALLRPVRHRSRSRGLLKPSLRSAGAQLRAVGSAWPRFAWWAASRWAYSSIDLAGL